MKCVETMENFAKTLYEFAQSDRDNIVACGGFTGEGKSTFLCKLQKEYARVSGTPWDFSHLTWDGTELLKWIDGDKDGNGQKPQYTAILVDELISLFFRRNWYEDPQKQAIELLNKCRDRHLFIGGNIPSFWELDTSFQTRVRFYIYIPRGRSVAWVLQQEDNPFCSDKWNKNENIKVFRKGKNPYRCSNFVCEIHFDDFTDEEKKEYLEIRNTKRKNTELQYKKKNVEEKYSKIKRQRDTLLRELFKTNPKLTNVYVEELLDYTMDNSFIAKIRTGEA